MKIRLIKLMAITVIAIAYAMVALSLPCLLLDHAFAMQAGDEHHSDRDVHAWIEWAAGSSLSEAPPPLAPSLAFEPALFLPCEVVRPVLSAFFPCLRGPPTLA